MKKTIITVVGKDTVGIIAKVCTYLAENNVNILDISQTIVQGFFNMMMVTDANNSQKDIMSWLTAWKARRFHRCKHSLPARGYLQQNAQDLKRTDKGKTTMINMFEVNETNKMITRRIWMSVLRSPWESVFWTAYPMIWKN